MKQKDLIKFFKESVLAVSKVCDRPPHELTRDEYIRIAIENDLPRLNKVRLNDLGGYAVALNQFFPKPQPTLSEISDDILSFYIDYVKQNGIVPSQRTLQDQGFTSSMVNKIFGGPFKLYAIASETDPEVFFNLVNDSLFTNQAHSELLDLVKQYKRFIIISAVSGKKANEKFLNSLKTYQEYEDALIIVQPCEDVASRRSIFKYELDRRLRPFPIAFRDVYLNDKVFLSSISVSAKQLHPLTGLDRLAQSRGSMILASPKQDLSFVANSNVKIPRALMTTGAVTVPDYSTDLSMSKRTSYLAEFDHVLGGIIVEIEDDRVFYFRQIQADPKDGSFIDLGWRYNADGTVQEVPESKHVFGDTHVGSHDPEVDKCLQEIAEETNCVEAVIHDLFDCRFNNHHEQNPVTKAILCKNNKTSMMKEAQLTAKWLENWTKRVKKLVIVKSNHDEALDRYIDEGRWKDDPENLYEACKLVRKKIEGKDVLRFLIEQMVGFRGSERVKWLKRDEDYLIYGIEAGAHGDKGANGSRGSFRGMENAYYKAIVAHSHSAGIWRQIVRVGTSTFRKLHYNIGPSSWTNTMCIVYPNESRQLITVIVTKDGQYKWRLNE